MRLVVLGGTGSIGRRIVEAALADGDEVVVVSRRARNSVDPSSAALSWIVGDATDPNDLGDALAGSSAVINALGIGGHGDGRATTVISRSARALVEAATRLGRAAPTLLLVSNVGVGSSGTAGGVLRRSVVWPLLLATSLRWLVPIIADKERAEAVLRSSAIAWMSVRLPDVVEGPARWRWRVDANGPVGLSITAADAARFCLDRVRLPTAAGSAVSVSN